MRVLYLGLMTTSEGFTGAMMRNSTAYTQLSCGGANFNTRACELANSFKPDLIFMQIQTPNILSKEAAIFLKNTGAFVINWTGDVRSPIPQWYYDIGKHIDLTCFSNMTDVRQFKKDGLASEYLEIGYDENIYSPHGQKTPTKDIVFMGNNYGDGYFPESTYRREMVEFLKANYPSNFALYGNGWSNSDGEVNGSQPNEAKLIRGAKIAINLSHFNYERYNSDRILRIMGSGAMCLTRRYDGIREDFEPGVNLAVWDNFDELKANIDHYLSNEAERTEVALKGTELMLKSFTYDSMILNIIKLAQ